MSYTLTEGALVKICAEQDSQNAVVQILGYKGINVSTEWIKRYFKGWIQTYVLHVSIIFSCNPVSCPTLL